ncbi:DUF4397 domain-containing protein [Natrarchaeobaculum aegyptiacum]|uniref:DUF4397 domain-containing protein n=1 Tax=Natrarchaeobaculum aegyptiacum TaxID=745377 RepID=A0A2Z2HR02_9EURY|nr:DUF4397 domain-containing protein [Natrarchaeobaculum aegyptiacum]ARS89571.1 hypothetical protein B1756_07330 [Natrarchaeobaculum aegyptiacum]
MDVSRRSTIKTIGVAGGLVATSGTAFATGEYGDDQPKKGAVEDDKRPEEPVDAAFVRVAHFSPDAPNVDVYVDGAPVLEDVAYGSISPYLELEPGTYTVAITAAGDPDAVVFEDKVAVEAAYYTVAAIGELEAGTFRPEILVDADPLPADGPDAAYVRVAHFSPDAPAVDIWADDAPLVENVSFGDVSEYLAVPAGAYTLSVRPAGDPVTDVATFDVELEAGTVYTGFAIGYLEPPQDVTDREFTVELAVDGEGVGESPDDGPAEKGDDKKADEKADDHEYDDKKADEKADNHEYNDKKADEKADNHEYDDKKHYDNVEDQKYDEKKADEKADGEKVPEKADKKPHA